MMAEVSFDGGRYEVDDLPPLDAVPIQDILRHSSERLVIRTSIGSFVFKHITKRMKDHLDRIRYTRYPKSFGLEQEAEIIFPQVVDGSADEDIVRRAGEIAAELQPSMDLYIMGILEYPFVTTVDEFEELMDSLKEDEREAIRQIHILLTSWNYPIDYSSLELAERFHLQLMDMQHIIEPTYEQYRALYGVIEQEHRETKKLYDRLGAVR